jgi:uncharacterized membrane protein YqaE (UPF0057 family)
MTNDPAALGAGLLTSPPRTFGHSSFDILSSFVIRHSSFFRHSSLRKRCSMRYVLAILLPPLGMALCGRVAQAIICAILMLTCIGWPVASIWAVLVVSDYHADQRNQEIIRVLRRE